MIAAALLAATLQLAGTPHASAEVVDGAVSVGVHVRLDRPFASRAEQARYAVVAAPHLKAGQKLPQRLFGGTSLGRISGTSAPWYAAEALQLRKRSSVEAGARWQVALVRSNRVVGRVKTVRLR